MPLDEPSDHRILLNFHCKRIWRELSKSSELFFPHHVVPRSTLTVSRRMNLCVSQVHEFSLMHRLNYSATKSYTVNVNYSSSNNRWRDILSARWQAPLWTATTLQIDSSLHYYYTLFYLPFPATEKMQTRRCKNNNHFRRVIICGSQLLAITVGDIIFFFFHFSSVCGARLHLRADCLDTFI